MFFDTLKQSIHYAQRCEDTSIFQWIFCWKVLQNRRKRISKREHTFLLSQIAEFMPPFLKEQLTTFSRSFQFVGTNGLEIQIPSTTTPDKNS